MSSDRSAADRLLRWAEFAGFAAATAVIVGLELSRHPEYLRRPASLLGFVPDPDATWIGLAMLAFCPTDLGQEIVRWLTWIGIPVIAAPIVWWMGKPRRSGEQGNEKAGEAYLPSPTGSDRARSPAPVLRGLFVSALLFVLSITLTAIVGRTFRGMPPAYHDEYSYVFQAKTFLAGRLYFEQHSLPDFFNQMHVLNDHGIFASRYFPGVGLWLAPWLALGNAYWGQYLAGGLVVVIVYWIGRELESVCDNAAHAPNGGAVHRSGNALGLLAAVFCAISPALLLFGNLLLSHHPTMLGLAVFVLGFLRALRSESVVWPLVGGIGLCLAMLCRPLTAFGFALPFGVYAGWLLARGRLPRARARLPAALMPLAAGVAVLAGYNTAITGNPMRSPYGLFNRIYTPNHIYGFHNVTRGEKMIGPKVRENYNRWAEDLTVPRAFELFGRRVAASAAWSIGSVTLAWVAAVSVVVVARNSVHWKLLIAAIVGLHAVYFPYGFDGIFALSYVFESVPILCLLSAGVFVWIGRQWRQRGQRGRIVWLIILVAFGLSDPLIRLVRGIVDIRFPRQYYAAFEEQARESGIQPPALIFIQSDPSDVHRDLVTNSPTLDDPILRVRADAAHSKQELIAMYPERQIWIFDARSGVFARLPTAAELQKNAPGHLTRTTIRPAHATRTALPLKTD